MVVPLVVRIVVLEGRQVARIDGLFLVVLIDEEVVRRIDRMVVIAAGHLVGRIEELRRRS